ncbi:MAG TPA: hypothetical protein VEL28_04815 [Candidatus Binatia bacterium]|nr:hypothetical protein [Candidatus Binatia bacterium]
MSTFTACRIHAAIAFLAVALVTLTATTADAGCDPGQWGPTCAECPGGQATPCNNHGTCDEGTEGTGTCACNVGYTGFACNQCGPDFYDYPACTHCTDSGTCTGNGECNMLGTCDCEPQYTGSSCSQCASSHYNYPSCVFCDSAMTCSNHGSCNLMGTCNCVPGYGGTACNQCAPGFAGYPSCVAVTTTTSTTMPLACPSEPIGTCLQIGATGKSVFKIKNSQDDTKDRLSFLWVKGDAFSQPATDDPSSTASYHLCVYDSFGPVQAHSFTMTVAPGTGWTDLDPKGWRYKDSSGAFAGVTGISLKTGEVGKTKAQLKAKGSGIPLPAPVDAGRFFSADEGVTVQLVNDDSGACWSATYTAAVRNLPTAFIATAP